MKYFYDKLGTNFAFVKEEYNYENDVTFLLTYIKSVP